jgi:hypothetical protein
MPQSPQVADTAPDEPFLTGYDMALLVTYLRLLDADAEGADWREVAAIVLELDVAKDPKRARRPAETLKHPHIDGRALSRWAPPVETDFTAAPFFSLAL